MEERSNSSYSTKWTEAKQLAGKGIEQNLPPKRTRRPLSLLLSPSFFYVYLSILSHSRTERIQNSDPQRSHNLKNQSLLIPDSAQLVSGLSEQAWLNSALSKNCNNICLRGKPVPRPRPPSHLPHSGTCQILQMHGEIKLLFKYIFLFLFRIGSIPSKFVMPQIKSF